MLNYLDQYGRARQDASRKYSAAFEGHHIQVFVIYVIVINIYLTNCRWRPRRFNEILAKQRYSCYHPIHCSKAYLDARYKEEDFPVTNQLVKEVISLPMHER
jgi:dTDP-4-amino-4,6-dideoxygalactose transaminase